MSDTSSPSQEPSGGGRRGVVIAVVIVVLVLVVAGAGLAVYRATSSDSGDSDETAGSSPAPSAASPSMGSSSGSPSADSTDSTDPALATYYGQKLSYGSCGTGFGADRCAILRVPLDYAKPQGRAISLVVLKVPAAEPSKRIGSLVVNPGGPGGSGAEYAAGGRAQFGKTLTDRYDVVGFDPRGVANSTPLKCVSDSQLDTLLAADPDPDTKAERTELDREVHGLGEGCLKESGDLTRHMSTVEAAKDIDILRSALGEKKLDYLGASYGTFLGATYANLFPTHVGRMVLDGAVDPALSNEQLSLAQAHGFEVALRAYVGFCVAQGSCPLGDSVDAGVKEVRTFLDSVEAKSLPTDSSRRLTVGTATLGVWLPLYAKSLWPQLTRAFTQAIDDKRGSALLALADQYTSRGPNGFTDNSFEALYAVNCLDHDDSIPTSQVPSHFAEFEKASPTFGKAFAFGLSTCSVWPVQSGNVTKAMQAKGAPPIVVVGTTRDPATPLAWAQALSKELDSGTLITRDGDGHTGFNMGNDCVDDAVNGYLVDGTVPKPDLMC